LKKKKSKKKRDIQINSISNLNENKDVSFSADSTLRIRIKGTVLVALIDTGSCVNCINANILNKIMPDYKDSLRRNNFTYRINPK
jgi:hypothetical protein